jgi:hypothetical protein
LLLPGYRISREVAEHPPRNHGKLAVEYIDAEIPRISLFVPFHSTSKQSHVGLLSFSQAVPSNVVTHILSQRTARPPFEFSHQVLLSLFEGDKSSSKVQLFHAGNPIAADRAYPEDAQFSHKVPYSQFSNRPATIEDHSIQSTFHAMRVLPSAISTFFDEIPLFLHLLAL